MLQSCGGEEGFEWKGVVAEGVTMMGANAVCAAGPRPLGAWTCGCGCGSSGRAFQKPPSFRLSVASISCQPIPSLADHPILPASSHGSVCSPGALATFCFARGLEPISPPAPATLGAAVLILTTLARGTLPSRLPRLHGPQIHPAFLLCCIYMLCSSAWEFSAVSFGAVCWLSRAWGDREADSCPVWGGHGGSWGQWEC